MTVIRRMIYRPSVADALQFISYYHPIDYIETLGGPTSASSPPPRRTPSRRSSPIRACAPRATARSARTPASSTLFVKVGMDVRWDAKRSLAEMVNEGVRRAYTHPDNMLRASVVADPAGARRNTRDNTPAVIHYEIVPGDTVEVTVAAKGGGSENKSKFVMLNPSRLASSTGC